MTPEEVQTFLDAHWDDIHPSQRDAVKKLSPAKKAKYVKTLAAGLAWDRPRIIHPAPAPAERAAACAVGYHAQVHKRSWAANQECPWCDTYRSQGEQS